MAMVRSANGLSSPTVAALLALLALATTASAATASDMRRSLRTTSPNSNSEPKASEICTIPGNTIIEAPPVSGDVSSAWGSAGYLSASNYHNDGCISADGYWRPACPAVGATANTSLPDNICISNKCGTFQLGGVIPPLFAVNGRRLQSRTLTLAPGYPAAAPCCPTHTSGPQDSFASIAAMAGVKPIVLTSFNRLSSDAKLSPKQTLTVPCPRALLFFEELMLSLGTVEKPAAFGG